MRLIDADKLIDNLDNMIPATDDNDYVMGIAAAIQEVGRMAYEDYIEAIPIEWLERKRMFHTACNDIFCANDIEYLIKEWKKENEKQTVG